MFDCSYHNFGSTIHDYCPFCKLAAIEAAVKGKEELIDALNALRPFWAQGHSDDSIAAQASYAALAQIFKVLGVTNQTDAIKRIASLEAAVREKEIDLERWKMKATQYQDRADNFYKQIAVLTAENAKYREALEKIEQRANERHSGEHERDVVYAMFYIAQAALKQTEPGGKEKKVTYKPVWRKDD
jgi:hypothetical protein